MTIIKWDVSNLLSLCQSTPIDTGRGGYTLTMRESHGASSALETLTQSRSHLNAETVHLGWGSFRNLDIAAARKSSWVLLLDINIYQLRVWDAVAVAMRLPDVTTAAAFIDAVIPLLPHKPRLRQFSESTLDWLTSDLDRPGSWMYKATPDRFDCIKALFNQHRVAVGCLDLRAGGLPEHSPFACMARALHAANLKHHIVFDTLYISNIPWMMAQPLGFFGESHQSQMGATSEPVLRRLHHNLSKIAPCFQKVISAAHLSEEALADNLQWGTDVLSPAAFLSKPYWQELGKKPDNYPTVLP